mgnify:CR=1 FL=1
MHADIISHVPCPPKLLKEMGKVAALIGRLYDENREVSITLTDDKHIQALNKTYRGLDEPTDVLSFALSEADEPSFDAPDSLGDVIISIERAAAQAEQFNHSLRREIIFLEVHGLLHLLGFDHINPDDQRLMEREQNFILKELRL